MVIMTVDISTTLNMTGKLILVEGIDPNRDTILEGDPASLIEYETKLISKPN